MASVEAHYQDLLAGVYPWMVGGLEAAIAQGAADLAGLRPRSGLAVDLGAGFGAHTLPLSQAGFEVIAIDSSAALLGQLRAQVGSAPVQVVLGDLLQFPNHLPEGRKADLILCMGDTLTHLPSEAAVTELLSRVSRSLNAGGQFVATFRDLSRVPEGDGRFIPVRSDADHILTCFLEDAGNRVVVHDLLHRRAGGQWTLQVSSYHKLKLSAEVLKRELARVGLQASVQTGARGMIRVVAEVRP